MKKFTFYLVMMVAIIAFELVGSSAIAQKTTSDKLKGLKAQTLPYKEIPGVPLRIRVGQQGSYQVYHSVFCIRSSFQCRR